MKEWFYALSSREQKLVLATVFVAIVGGLYIGGMLLFASDAEVSEATATQFQDVLEKIDNVDQQKGVNRNLKKRLGNQNSMFVEENETGKITAQLYQTAQQSGIKLKVVSPTINQKSKPFPSADIRMSFECQFNQLIQFFGNLKKSEILVQPSSMKLQLKDPNQPNLEVQMTVTTFFLNSRPQSGVRS